MRHGINYKAAVFTLLITPLLAKADVWVPPWGESLYDSTLVTVLYSDTAIDVTIATKMAARKFVSDDYILTWTRNDSGGFINHRFTEGTFSDSILEFDRNSRFGTQLRGISRCQLEDTASFTLITRLHYPATNEVLPPQSLAYRQNFSNYTDDPAWGGWGLLFERSVRWHFRVVSNREVTAWAGDGHGGRPTGQDISFSGETHWDLSYSGGVLLSDVHSFIDTVDDTIMYGLTPEVRMATPGIILDEDVRIYISYADNGAWHYMQHADINLEPELARSLSPMYLWYPNDETSARVRLQGFKMSGIWGHESEVWQDDSAEVHIVRDGGQNGFFIKIPSLECEYQTPNGYWHWTDVRLQVDIDQALVGGETARFILITAPLDYSRLNFAITDGWETGFVRWDNPFDDLVVNPDRTRLTMRGICDEPGVAQVWWGPVSVGNERVVDVPAEFCLTSVAPNPFNSRTTIRYELPKASDVQMDVVDMSGRSMHSEQIAGETGQNTISIDAVNLPAGIYLLQVTSEGKALRAKVVCVK